MDEPILDTDSPGRGDSPLPEDVESQRGSASQVRKAQNRLAQREFRLRKQQYIRDLEARVEVLSGDKEERADLLTLLIRNLLKENKDLRGMVKTMAGFIGEGLGSCLPRLGLTAAQLDAIMNQTEDETAHAAFLALKAARDAPEASTSAAAAAAGASSRLPHSPRRGGSTSKRKRAPRGAADPEATGGGDESAAAGKGKGKAADVGEDDVEDPDDYLYLFPELENMLEGTSDARPPSTGPSQHDLGTYDLDAQYVPTPSQGYDMLPERPSSEGGPAPPSIWQRQAVYDPMLRGATTFGPTVAGSSLTSTMSSVAGASVPPNAVLSPPDYAQLHPQLFHAGPGMSEVERQRYMGSAVADMTNPTATSVFGPGMTGAKIAARRRDKHGYMMQENPADPARRRMDAMQLITYHLDNYRNNPDYHLPPSLQPTTIQRTIPHEHAIDGIIFPTIRDRLILLRGQYDLVTIFQAMLTEIRLSGDNPLDHRNYEVTQAFCRDYGSLVDDEVYGISNKWRSMRGEPPLPRPEQLLPGPPGPIPASGTGLGQGGPA